MADVSLATYGKRKGTNSTSLNAWPGAGNTATFAGTEGKYTVNVSGVQSIDSITFLSAMYSVNGGTINLGIKNGIYVAKDKNAIIESIIKGSAGVSKYGEGTLILTGTNTFTGTTAIKAGILQLGNGGSTGSIHGPIANNGLFVDMRTNVDTINDVISGVGKFLKSGPGTLSLNGANTYTGATTVSAGTLLVNGSITAGGAVSIAFGATLGGTGICYGPVDNSGTIAPGNSNPGKLSTGDLKLNASSVLHFDLGTKSDTIAVAGAFVLDGTINFSTAAGFSAGFYRIITYSGTLTDNTLTIGSLPAGMDCKFIFGNGYINAIVTLRLILAQPNDTIVGIGRSALFSVSAKGGSSLVYKWLHYPSDSVGNAATFSIGTVTQADNGARFRCVVWDSTLTDSSRWAVLTVIDTPRIVIQPQDVNVTQGGDSHVLFIGKGYNSSDVFLV